MEEACSVCERVTTYKCIKCKVSVCALCGPETAQTVNEVDYSPMKLVGVCQTCQRRPEIDKEANTTADTMPPESLRYFAKRNETKQNEMVFCAMVLCETVFGEMVFCETVLCEMAPFGTACPWNKLD